MRHKIAKRKLRPLVLSTVLLALASSSLPAEEASQPAPASLRDCIAIAMRSNVDGLTSRNNVTVAKSGVVKAKSDYLPQASVQNNTFAWGSKGVLSQTTTGTALTVSENIYDGGLREANVKSARFGLTGSSAALARTLQSVEFNVSNAYYEVLRTRHLAAVARTNVAYNEALRNQIEARAAEGDAAKVDILPVEAQLASANVALLSSENAVRTSIIQLQSVMGVSSTPGFNVQEVDNSDVAQVGTLEDYMTAALMSRPDVTQSQAAVGAAKALVKSTRIALYPRPTVTASYQRQVSGGFTSSASQVVGGIAFNIFDGGASRADYKGAVAGQSNALIQEEQLQRDIRSQVEEAYLNLTNAKERMSASSVSLDAANKNYSAQNERYAQGLGTTLDLLNAEVQVVTAESDSVQARYDYYIAVAQMDYAVGRQGESDEK